MHKANTSVSPTSDRIGFDASGSLRLRGALDLLIALGLLLRPAR
jgi:hypothetical protein